MRRSLLGTEKPATFAQGFLPNTALQKDARHARASELQR
jgi:hypothetical protein